MSPLRRHSKLRGRAEMLALFGGSALVAIAGIVIALQFVQPAPPSTIRMATGDPKGAYYHYGERYRAILANSGITLELVETAGTVDNLALLQDPGAPVDLALVQGGVASDEQRLALSGLGSMFYEPIWLLAPAGAPARPLHDLQGARIAIGPEDSGTRFLARRMLAANGIDSDNAVLITEDIERSAQRLVAGELDLMFVVGAPDSPLLRELVRDSKIQLQRLPRAAAYARRDGALTALQLPQGALDLAADVPAADLSLVAATANLVVREDFHPALVALLLGAATEVHAQRTLLADADTFPTPAHSDFPLSEDAARYYKNGPPFLQRWLPFWVANWIDRIKIMLVPLLALLLPISKMLPPAYRWRIRKRILRWYKDLRAIDLEVQTDDPSPQRLRVLRDDLNIMETEAAQVAVPLGYTDQLYELRLHIALLQGKLERLTKRPSEAA